MLFQVTDGQSQRFFKVDNMNLLGIVENKIPGFKNINEEIQMNSTRSLVQEITDKRRQAKRVPFIPFRPNPPIKRVILGRKNQLVRMMKRASGAPVKNPYIRIN